MYFEVLEMNNFSQTAPRMMVAIKHSFKENEHTTLWQQLERFWANSTIPGKTQKGSVCVVLQLLVGVSIEECSARFY